MKKEVPYHVKSVSEQHRILSLPKPHHPLVSVFNFDEMQYNADQQYRNILLDLYCVSIKRNVYGKMKYGQNHYDFDEGVMVFTGPKQVVSNIPENHKPSGWCLVFHPDFIRKHPLGAKIKEYAFFSYAVHEALHLSAEEEETVINIMKMLQAESAKNIDGFTEPVIISYIDLLLSYADRFYNRQFITRKTLNSDLLSRFEALLNDYFDHPEQQEMPLPTVHYFTDRLHFSPNYLSNLLNSLTGKSTQQHIQDKLIEKAKELLATTELSVAEIAYTFGFEYPQSFNKLFRNKTKLSPLAYRKLLH
ncbi:helix-turn-helix domain-containing protein [Chitinophaga horti]|uniref:Helix-turn-helix domain-containing protein n=1 Tax=Chitinophaga horti TaxID=2920382 RepID=A0ABY6J766_9BACT|nr:helix-turn-helix domain-containing protein [Chitinophaga horti]UYQ95525.1 helix-turn-helix domain-containing protein [Chitinophaga horti]